jgi:hypothetical protein
MTKLLDAVFLLAILPVRVILAFDRVVDSHRARAVSIAEVKALTGATEGASTDRHLNVLTMSSSKGLPAA